MNTFWEDIRALIARPWVTLVILVLISLGICGIYANEGQSGPIHSIQSAIETSLLPFSNVSQSANNTMTTISDYLFNKTYDEDTVNSLKEENANLKTKLVAAEKYKVEAERLENILKLKNQYNADGVCARVIANSNSAYNQTITVSAGSDKGVHAGLTVLGENGVVGQVVSTSMDSSVIRVITDPNSGVAVKLPSENSDCILKGSLDGVLYLEGLDVNANVNVGDSVITSGLGGSYVEGLFVGSVSQIIQSQSGGNRKIIVSPIEQPSSLREVLIVMESE